MLALTAYRNNSVVTTQWFGLVASTGHLALAMATFLTRDKNPLRLPLSLLCLDLFFWNFADWANGITHNALWTWLDVTASPLAAPLTLHLILVFTGEHRSKRTVLVLVYVLFGLLSLLGVLAALLIAVRRTITWGTWATAMLTMAIPTIGATILLLVRHYRRFDAREERFRTSLMLTALVVGGALGISDVLEDFVAALPNLSATGTLFATLVLFVVLLRSGVMTQVPATRTVGYIVVLALLAVTFIANAVTAFAGDAVAILVASGVACAALAFGMQEFLGLRHAQLTRGRDLALLGRMTQQLAHDLKNPLAALKGAVQYLEEESKRSAHGARESRMLELVSEQLARVDGTIDRYMRMSHVEPRREPSDIGVLVTRVTKACVPPNGPWTVSLHMPPSLPEVSVDPELIGLAVQNLVTNAMEASKDTDTPRITVAGHFELASRPGRGDGVVLTISDNGPGIDPRISELVWDDFFTTKSRGSGLGLAFVRRIVNAHEGVATLRSALGTGTSVRLWLPSQQPRLTSSDESITAASPGCR